MNKNPLTPNTKVVWIATGQRALIMATKDVPYEPEKDPYNRKKIFSEKGYLIYLVKEISGDRVEYLGSADVYENEIEEYNW